MVVFVISKKAPDNKNGLAFSIVGVHINPKANKNKNRVCSNLK
jgi:hypothetical protein